MKNQFDYKSCVFGSLQTIGINKDKIELNSKLVTDLNLESIDIIDLFFEIQQQSGLEIDLNEIATIIGGINGRRFNDISVLDVINYLEMKK